MWEGAVERELEDLSDYGTFEFSTCTPTHACSITSMVVLPQILDVNVLLLQFKKQLEAYGFWQCSGYDYHESSALLVDLHLARLLLYVSATNNADTSQVKVKTAFLEDKLDEQI